MDAETTTSAGKPIPPLAIYLNPELVSDLKEGYADFLEPIIGSRPAVDDTSHDAWISSVAAHLTTLGYHK